MEKFVLNITASSGEFFQGECESLTLPTADGQYGVQAGHSPVLVALEMGIMQFTVNGETRNVLVGDGIAEVTPAYVVLLVDSAERPEDIDKNRAEAARIRAEERLQHKQSMHEYYQSKIALNRAMQRLQATAKYNRLLPPKIVATRSVQGIPAQSGWLCFILYLLFVLIRLTCYSNFMSKLRFSLFLVDKAAQTVYNQQ